MPRRYDTALLEKMNANARCVTHEGVEVLLKPIPDGGAPGDMDPRLYKSMRLMPLMVHFMPKTKPSATPLEQVTPLRKMFAEYKYDFVVTEGVSTEHITVKSADRYDVPVRIYKRERRRKRPSDFCILSRRRLLRRRSRHSRADVYASGAKARLRCLERGLPLLPGKPLSSPC